ncbi:MAG: ligase [Acidimicrobiales bacterium]|nr:ligase [Acidimicrobiales bacterium]
MLLADLVATTEAVRATRARSAKVAALADLLRRLAPEERLPATALLAGEPRQGKVGIGWATVAEAGEGVEPAAEPTLTVADLDGTLDAVAALSGPGSGGARVAAIRALLVRATEAEAELLRRLLLGDLRQGALEGIMADAVASAAGVPAALVRRAAMLAGDLPAVAEQALAGGAEALAGVGLRVLTPVQPMLAATSATVAEAVAGCGRSSVEWKLDGARVQAHRAGDEVRLFTRNLNDVTARLPGVADVVRSLPVGSVVLDGEVLYGGERPAAFQDTMRRFSNQSGGGSGLGVWFFDVLHVDGTDLLDEPLEARVEVLERVAGPWRIPGTLTDDPEEAAGVLDDALANGHEGVVVKGASSLYEAGRRGSAWRKVKPVRTLDLVVLAAEWGHGRRQGWLSNLHLGARDPAGGFVMVGKTFKGLTDELLAWQTEQLLAREQGRSGIVVEVRPELVVEIALDGVQASPRYPGGVALRFARVRRYRDDKGPAEADLIGDVQALLPGRS